MIINLPNSKVTAVQHIEKMDQLKYIELIYLLGGLISLKQITEIYAYNENIESYDYARKKCSLMIKQFTEHKIVDVFNVEQFKFIKLKRLGYSFITNDYNKYKRISQKQLFKYNSIQISLLKAQYYIDTKNIYSLDNAKRQLLDITNNILKVKQKDKNLIYSESLLKKILSTNSIDEVYQEIYELSPDNIIRIIWIDIYDIFKKLKLQHQAISIKSFYYKLFKRNNQLYIHYVPEILMFDIHSKSYYIDKVSSLFNQFIKISSNNTMNMNSNYTKTNMLGYEGFNHIGYTIKLIGPDLKSLKQKQQHINTFVLNNPDSMFIGTTDIVCLDIRKYLSNASRSLTILEDIDNQIDAELNKLLENY